VYTLNPELGLDGADETGVLVPMVDVDRKEDSGEDEVGDGLGWDVEDNNAAGKCMAPCQ
jgi:hypothetical protein